MSAADETDLSTTSRFRLTLPAQTAHLQLVRLTVAALASDVLSVEEIEDAKVAVEELTAAAMAPVAGEPDIHLEFLVDSDSLAVQGERSLDADAQVVTHDFLSTILDAVCDTHEIGTTAGRASFSFKKSLVGDDRIDPRFREFAATRDQDLRNQLVVDNQGLAKAFAGRYRNRGVTTDDLDQIALEALVRAVDRFEPERGLKFSTYAARTIEGSLRQYFRDRTWDTTVSRSQRQLVTSIRAVSESLTQQLSRSPTPAEIANQLGVDLADVTMALESAAGYKTAPLTLDQEQGSSDVSEFDAAEARAVLPALLNTLSDAERRAVELRFFDGMSQDDIAAQLGVSQMQVSRLLRRSLERLRTQV